MQPCLLIFNLQPAFSMSGTRNINLFLACIISGIASADDIRLKNNARLSGEVISIAGDGAVELRSPLSAEPFSVKGDAVERVLFKASDSPNKSTSALVELVNGDTIPCSIASYDGKILAIDSPSLGELEIRAEHIKSIQAGVLNSKTIYSGPNDLAEWTVEKQHAGNWNYNDGILNSNGSGRVTMVPKNPEHFILKFTIGWQQQPNFQIGFADPLAQTGDKTDRYYLQYGNAGLEIKREASEGRRYTTIVQLNRTPDQYPGNTMDIEIRVDRKESLIYLFINGEPEGRYKDPVGKPPIAGGISLTANAPNGTSQQFSKIQLIDWNLAKDRHQSEERGNPKADALIISGGDRFGGRLKSVRKSPDGMIYSFKSDFQDDLLEIPESEVSTVFFATPDKQKNEDAKPANIIFRFRSSGSMRVNSCSFDATHADAEHPLLGKLRVARSGIAALEHQQTPPKAKLAP